MTMGYREAVTTEGKAVVSRDERDGRDIATIEATKTGIADGQGQPPASATESDLAQAAAERAQARQVLGHGESGVALVAESVNAWYGSTHAIKDVTMTFRANEVTALIGPPAAASPPSCAASTGCTRSYPVRASRARF